MHDMQGSSHRQARPKPVLAPPPVPAATTLERSSTIREKSSDSAWNFLAVEVP